MHSETLEEKSQNFSTFCLICLSPTPIEGKSG